MIFDFHDQYRNYSNIELLKIIKQPAAYQAAAIDAATQILKDRSVSEKEYEDAENIINDIKIKDQDKQQRVELMKAAAVNLVEPVLMPQAEFSPKKWLNFFLLIVTLQYAWQFYKTARHIIRYLRCAFCAFDFNTLFDLLDLAYVPVIFLLLFKRKRWGWIFLFADNLLSFIFQLSESYNFYKYQTFAIHHASTIAFVEPIILRGFFAFFLWKNAVAGYFGITKEVKKKTAIVTAAIALSLFVAVKIYVYLFYR